MDDVASILGLWMGNDGGGRKAFSTMSQNKERNRGGKVHSVSVKEQQSYLSGSYKPVFIEHLVYARNGEDEKKKR